jgi:hypothetical protein
MSEVKNISVEQANALLEAGYTPEDIKGFTDSLTTISVTGQSLGLPQKSSEESNEVLETLKQIVGLLTPEEEVVEEEEKEVKEVTPVYDDEFANTVIEQFKAANTLVKELSSRVVKLEGEVANLLKELGQTPEDSKKSWAQGLFTISEEELKTASEANVNNNEQPENMTEILFGGK